MRHIFLILACLASFAHAQVLVVKVGADGKVFEPQPLNIGVSTATSYNGLTISTSTGTLTIANSASLITSGAYAVTLTATATTGVTLPTTGTLATLAGSEALSNKSLAGSSATMTGAITSSSPSAKIGYATGAGGAVTQGTSRSTTVVMVPNPCVSGTITTTADSLAALATATFTVTNSAVVAGDTIIPTKVSGDVDTEVRVNSVGTGSFTVSLYNTHITDADVTAFVLNFAIVKSVAN